MSAAASDAFTLACVKAEARIDSRLLALHLGNQHKATMALIERYADQFKTFVQLPFKKEVGDPGRADMI